MQELHIEFTNKTRVVTENGVEFLADILHRGVNPCLWAIRWKLGSKCNGISFHESHKSARSFVQQQLDSDPDGPARLVDVSAKIYDCVKENGYCWTELEDFDQALDYEGRTWSR